MTSFKRPLRRYFREDPETIYSYVKFKKEYQDKYLIASEIAYYLIEDLAFELSEKKIECKIYKIRKEIRFAFLGQGYIIRYDEYGYFCNVGNQASFTAMTLQEFVSKMIRFCNVHPLLEAVLFRGKDYKSVRHLPFDGKYFW